MTDIPELTGDQFKNAIPARLRKRLMQGRFESGKDIAALRKKDFWDRNTMLSTRTISKTTS